jgi:hypothetical protein
MFVAVALAAVQHVPEDRVPILEPCRVRLPACHERIEGVVMSQNESVKGMGPVKLRRVGVARCNHTEVALNISGNLVLRISACE